MDKFDKIPIWVVIVFALAALELVFASGLGLLPLT